MSGTQSVHTSQSHPIRVSWIVHGPTGGGRLGLCHCPGKKVIRENIRHERDLQADLAHLKQEHQATAIVCLLNQAELSSFGLRDFNAQVLKSGLQLIQYPIIEMAPPDSLKDAADVVERIVQLIKAGEVVIMHCRGGVGRAGLMAACTLLRMREAATAQEAINVVRWRRCKSAVETTRQEEFVAQYEVHLKSALLPVLQAEEQEEEDEDGEEQPSQGGSLGV